MIPHHHACFLKAVIKAANTQVGEFQLHLRLSYREQRPKGEFVRNYKKSGVLIGQSEVGKGLADILATC